MATNSAETGIPFTITRADGTTYSVRLTAGNFGSSVYMSAFYAQLSADGHVSMHNAHGRQWTNPDA